MPKMSAVIARSRARPGTDENSDPLGLSKNIGAEPPQVSYNTDMFEHLMGTPMLCEVVCLMSGDIAQDKDLRAQRAAALRARWVGQCYNSLPWLFSPHVSNADQYTTDPNTGECKTQ